jgi:hypothetical protein
MENWINIRGFEELYQISSAGRVRSLARVCEGSRGGKRPVKERLLKYVPDKQGRRRVCLYKDGIGKYFKVSTLVALHFLANPENYTVVCHKDDDVTNDNVTNLFWGTHAMNVADKVSKGRQSRGSSHGMAKLSESDVLNIRMLANNGFKQSELCSIYNMSSGLMSGIISKKRWKHL